MLEKEVNSPLKREVGKNLPKKDVKLLLFVYQKSF
jgi:hypothetical protein